MLQVNAWKLISDLPDESEPVSAYAKNTILLQRWAVSYTMSWSMGIISLFGV
jgi:hypothetical protein